MEASQKKRSLVFGDAKQLPPHWRECHGLLQTRPHVSRLEAPAQRAEAGRSLTLTGCLAKGRAAISDPRIKHHKLLPHSAGNLGLETWTDHEEAEIQIMYLKHHKFWFPPSCKHPNSVTKHLKFCQDYALLLVAILYSKSQMSSKIAAFSSGPQTCSLPIPTGIPSLQLCQAPNVTPCMWPLGR